MGGDMSRAAEARSKLDEFGIDGVCDAIGSANSLTKIASDIGVSIGSLLTWIEADPERSARARETRSAMARYWDEKAERCLAEAPDEFELKRAKELSHHYRWRAAKTSPREYGDRVEQHHTGGIGSTDASLTDAQRAALDRVLDEDV